MQMYRILLIIILTSTHHYIRPCWPWCTTESEPTTARNELHIAITSSNNAKAKQLIAQHPTIIDMPDTKGNTPLIESLRSKNLVMTYYLLKSKANPNTKSENGLSPIHVAAQTDAYRAAVLLKDKKADLSSKTENGETWIDFIEQMHPTRLPMYQRLHDADQTTFDRMYIGSFGCFCCCQGCSYRCDSLRCDCCLEA